LDHFRYGSHGCSAASGKDNRVLVCPLCQKGVRLVPKEDPIPLLFIRLIFVRLRKMAKCKYQHPGEETLPFPDFERAFERLFYALQEPMEEISSLRRRRPTVFPVSLMLLLPLSQVTWPQGWEAMLSQIARKPWITGWLGDLGRKIRIDHYLF